MNNINLVLVAVKGSSHEIENLVIGDQKEFDYKALSNIMRHHRGITIHFNDYSRRTWTTSSVKSFGFFMEAETEFFMVNTGNSQYIYKVY